MMSFIRLVFLIVSAYLLASANAFALDKTSPIRIIVPYGPGGVVDVMNRIIANRMSELMGQPVVIENRAGANANLGPAAVVQASANGHTLLASASYFTINPLIEKNLQWQPSSLVPLARFAMSPSVVVVPGNAPYSSLNDFLAAARARPGMPFGDGGIGAPQSMTKEILSNAAKVKFLSIQYKGGVSYLPDLLNGTLAMAILPVNTVLSLVKDGQLKALAITSVARSSLLPNVPTMIESGFPQASVESWLGFHVPAGTPGDAMDRLLMAVKAAAADSEVQSKFEKLGAISAFQEPEAFKAFLRDDFKRAESYVRLVGGN